MISWENFIVTIKRYWYRYVVVTLLLSLLAGVWLEWREEQTFAVARVEADYNSVMTEQVKWLNLSSEVHAEASRPGAAYPERDALVPLYEAVRQTLDEMTSFYAPTEAIAESARNYRNALQDVSGAINQYRADDESMSRLLNSLQVAANVGGDFRNDIDRYRTEAWRSFLSILL